ncbi:6-hydroxymethylpterin diphosphokinase MptE-like protein [Magnetococcales bacterium HHB-1]
MNNPNADQKACFEKNRLMIEAQWPHVWEMIQGLTRCHITVVEGAAPKKATLAVDGIHLSGMYDRLRDAELLARRVPNSSRQAWVYGVGLGDVPSVMLMRPSIQRLWVVLVNPELFLTSLYFIDHTGWMKDARTQLVFPSTNDIVRQPFTAIPSSLRLVNPKSVGFRLAAQVSLELATPYMNRDFVQNQHLKERIRKAEERVVQDRDVAALFSTVKGGHVVVAGAGPTLSEQFSWMRTERDRFFLIAVDAAFKPLQQAGLLPDMVVSIDPYPVVLAMFYPLDRESCRDIPLVYFPVLDDNVLDHWPGPRYVAYSNSEIYRELKERVSRGVLFASGIVLHPTVDLAVRMGYDRITLVGADFSFPQGRRSVSTSSVHTFLDPVGNHTPVTVENCVGEQVQTIPAFRNALLDFEHYISRAAKIHFFKAGSQGAKIRGVGSLESAGLLRHALDQYPQDEEEKILFPVPENEAEWPEYLETLLDTAENLLTRRAFGLAEKAFNEALWSALEQENMIAEARSQCGLASVYAAQKHLEEAATLFRHALSLFEKARDRTREAETRQRLAALLVEQQAFLEAAENFEQAMALFRALDDPIGEARTHRNLAQFFAKKDQIDKAESSLKNSLVVFSKLKNWREEAETCSALGILFRQVNQFEKSAAAFQRASLLFRKIKDPLGNALARNQLYELKLEGRTSLEERKNCLVLLERAALAFRQGMEAQGSADLTKMIDCFLEKIRSGVLQAEKQQQVTPLLQVLMNAQKRKDLLHLADILEYQLAPLWEKEA